MNIALNGSLLNCKSRRFVHSFCCGIDGIHFLRAALCIYCMNKHNPSMKADMGGKLGFVGPSLHGILRFNAYCCLEWIQI